MLAGDRGETPEPVGNMDSAAAKRLNGSETKHSQQKIYIAFKWQRSE